MQEFLSNKSPNILTSNEAYMYFHTLSAEFDFPIRCRCVLKAIIHRKKQWNVLRLLEKAFSFSKRCFLYVIVHACSI